LSCCATGLGSVNEEELQGLVGDVVITSTRRERERVVEDGARAAI
jgi:hypothetical protein